MPFHDNAGLDAAFNTTYGAAYVATVTPLVGDAYDAPAILSYDVEMHDDNHGITQRTTTLEFRKADLADPSAGLLRGTTVLANGRTFYIEEMLAESTYTLTYYTTK